MTRRAPLPIALQHSAFAFGTGRTAGASEHRLRASDIIRPFWGTRAHADEPLTLHDLCRTVLQRLPPGTVISHTTAALLHAIPLPTKLEQEHFLHLSVAAPTRAQHARGIRGHSIRLSDDDVQWFQDVPLTTPTRTWCDLGSILTDVNDLIVAGDRLLYWKDSLTNLAELAAAVARHRRQRGSARLTAALPELVDRAESPRESRVRLALIAGGLPRPVLNYELFSSSGLFIARGDLAYPEFRMLLDYEGEHHRVDRQQWNRDLTRFNDIQDEDWYSMRIGSEHALDDVVARVRAALIRRGWRP
ncbi:hypothetical protein [Orlajensenia leifsoniae]|uniref:SOCS box domain-containing protein n=1 Tax=Orlajensenia leifsoniae TaxID=2561933 RepID=A0A4Y9QRW8_9MICO|nr:hypothetical protein [Leifsonia flava]TFV95000.1 hypothetical protein E4M00_16615 [Leifsonia flava]